MTARNVVATATESDAHRLGSASGWQRVTGVCPVLEVPFTTDGEVDFGGFARVARHVIGCGVTSVMFPGYASEFLKLSDGERWRLVETLLGETGAAGGVAAVCAVQDHATVLATRHARRLVELGADAINLLPPYQLHPSAADVRRHIQTVLDAVAPIPVVLQYAPAQTGTSLDAAAIADMASRHPNLAMVKVESTPPGPLIAALREGTPSLPAMVGYAGVQLPDALRRGAVGVQPGCSFTEIYVRIWELYVAGDETAAFALHQRLLPYISYWMLGSELIVAAEKEISKRRGLFASAFCRAPAHALDTEELAAIDRFMAEFADLLPDLSELSEPR